MKEIDELAKALAVRYGMPSDIHVPIAARDKESIEKYIGPTTTTFQNTHRINVIIITLDDTESNHKKSAVWKVKGSEILHYPLQVWVHVDFTGYRKAYQNAFPEADLTNLVIDHIMNRRLARLKGFDYLRIIPISRAANTNSGTISEKYGFDYHQTLRSNSTHNPKGPFIQYADIADIVKMLNLKTGGDFQDGVNEALKYLLEEK